MATYGEALVEMATGLADALERTAIDFIVIARDLRKSLDSPSTELAEIVTEAMKAWSDEEGEG